MPLLGFVKSADERKRSRGITLRLGLRGLFLFGRLIVISGLSFFDIAGNDELYCLGGIYEGFIKQCHILVIGCAEDMVYKIVLGLTDADADTDKILPAELFDDAAHAVMRAG